MAVQSVSPAGPDSLDELRARLAGELITPEHHEYESARRCGTA